MKKIISLIGFVASILLITFIITLNILPTKYLLLIVGVLLLILVREKLTFISSH